MFRQNISHDRSNLLFQISCVLHTRPIAPFVGARETIFRLMFAVLLMILAGYLWMSIGQKRDEFESRDAADRVSSCFARLFGHSRAK